MTKLARPDQLHVGASLYAIEEPPNIDLGSSWGAGLYRWTPRWMPGIDLYIVTHAGRVIGWSDCYYAALWGYHSLRRYEKD